MLETFIYKVENMKSLHAEQLLVLVYSISLNGQMKILQYKKKILKS
jgi:hypothetical protein